VTQIVTLLCPITDFPYMLPECAPLGTIFVVSLLVPLTMVALLLRRHLRRKAARRFALVWVKGIVRGPGRRGDGIAGPFRLASGTSEVLVSPPQGAPPLRVGQRVAVAGVEGGAAPFGERLFRQPSLLPAIEATEIDRGLSRRALAISLVVLLAWLALGVSLLTFHGRVRAVGALRLIRAARDDAALILRAQLSESASATPSARPTSSAGQTLARVVEGKHTLISRGASMSSRSTPSTGSTAAYSRS
jgi:hypothetical protein